MIISIKCKEDFITAFCITSNVFKAILIALRDVGNSVIVVEHDEDTIMTSDHIVDIGPNAGIHGGEVIFSGKPSKLKKL